MLLLAGLVAGVPAFAAQQKEQHHWYVLNFQDGGVPRGRRRSSSDRDS
jgi:hypothetical protein